MAHYNISSNGGGGGIQKIWTQAGRNLTADSKKQWSVIWATGLGHCGGRVTEGCFLIGRS